MPTDVLMPQMGESIFEGTITKWLKKPGEKVQRDEPLFEISTDKVDAEIPAPASGVLKEIKVPEGSTVQVNTVVGVIDGEGTGAKAAAEPAPTPAPAKPAPASPAPTAATTKGGVAATDGGASTKQAPPPAAREPEEEEVGETEEGKRIRSSPVVRRMAKEHGIDLSQVSGTGSGGRISKEDIEKFVA